MSISFGHHSAKLKLNIEKHFEKCLTSSQCSFLNDAIKNHKVFENPYILIPNCKASIDVITQDFGTELLMVDLSS